MESLGVKKLFHRDQPSYDIYQNLFIFFLFRVI